MPHNPPEGPLLAAFLAGARWGLDAGAEVVDAKHAEDMTLAARLNAAGHHKIVDRQLLIACRLETVAAEIRVQVPDTLALPAFRAWLAEFEGEVRREHFGKENDDGG